MSAENEFKEDPPKPLGVCNHQLVKLIPVTGVREFTHQCSRCCTFLNITERIR